jgi:hypothetical protein
MADKFPLLATQGNSESGLLYWKQKLAETCAVKKIPINTLCCQSTIQCNDAVYMGGVTSQSLLETQQENFLACVANTAIISSATNQLSPEVQAKTASQITALRDEYSRNRILPYQRLPPPIIPQSVIDLQMATVNVGVPHTIVDRCISRSAAAIT